MRSCHPLEFSHAHIDIFSGKHLLNSPSGLVVDSLKGLLALNPQLALEVENKGNFFFTIFGALPLTGLTSLRHPVLYVQSPDRSKVALMCGGGSGHEPAHAGFVGELYTRYISHFMSLPNDDHRERHAYRRVLFPLFSFPLLIIANKQGLCVAASLRLQTLVKYCEALSSSIMIKGQCSNRYVASRYKF